MADRYELGVEVLRQVGAPDYAAGFEALKEIAPDLVRFTVEFGYGDVMSRPGLDLKTRQLATVAALTAMGNAQPQLRFHINGALNVGASGAEIVEVIILNAVYAGFPAALNGAWTAKEVFEKCAIRFTAVEADKTNDRYARGMRALEEISGASGADVVRGLQDIAPDLARFIIEFSYGDIIARPCLDNRTKELCTVALLTALGNARPQLEVHIRAALKVGASRIEVIEAIQQMAVYAGFPAALNGITAARRVLSTATS